MRKSELNTSAWCLLRFPSHWATSSAGIVDVWPCLWGDVVLGGQQPGDAEETGTSGSPLRGHTIPSQ